MQRFKFIIWARYCSFNRKQLWQWCQTWKHRWLIVQEDDTSCFCDFKHDQPGSAWQIWRAILSLTQAKLRKPHRAQKQPRCFQTTTLSEHISWFSVKSQISEIRAIMGICPQHDILFDDLKGKNLSQKITSQYNSRIKIF